MVSRSSRPRRITGLVAPLAAAGLLAGCVPGTGGTGMTNTARTGAVTTDPDRMGRVTLHVLDYFTGDPDDSWMKSVVKAFETQYPNITVDRTSLPWSDVMAALPLKLKSDNAPDIVPANQGWQSLGTLVRGGLVLNLDSYAKAYGWKKDFPRSIVEQHEFTTDGKQMGTGAMFGVPAARASLIEVYYNRALLKKLGAKVPRSYDDFEQLLGKAKAAGATPVSLGNADQLGVSPPLFSLMNTFGSKKAISDFINSQPGASIDQAGFPQAVSAFKKWSDKGYLGKDYTGIDAAAAAQDFVNGKGLFHFNYSGSLPLKPGQSKNFGSFMLPREDGGKPLATASSATNFSIASKSRHPDAAAAFLNFVAGKKAAGLAAKKGTMPLLHPEVEATGKDPLFADDMAISQDISANGTAVPYLDWAAPTFFTAMNRYMQNMLAGKASVSDVVDAVDDSVTTFQKTLGR